MNRTFEIIKNIYKPHRITLKGKTSIFETTNGKFLVKEKGQSSIKNLYKYLISRNFDNFPSLIDGDRVELNVFEYIEDIDTPKEQKALDLIGVISNLHNKTTYYKEVTEDKYKSIYEEILYNINYLKEVYNKEFERIVHVVYMSPSDYLLIRNSSGILACLDFAARELDQWYKLVKESKKQRVAMVHNNLSLDHFIRNEKEYLVSWEKSKIDTPVLDFISLYKNEFRGLEFEVLINKYLEKYPLNEDELKLIFIVLALPEAPKITGSEFNKTKEVGKILDYIYKTEKLIRPYYPENEPEKTAQLNKQD